VTLVAHIELPYDRGHQWHLVVGNQRAVISQRAAFALVGGFGIQIQGEPLLTELSKKARRMLIDAEIVQEYP